MSFLTLYSPLLFAWNKDEKPVSILIFASFSMPKESLEQWLHEASIVGAPVILRGFVGSSLKDTALAIQQLEGGKQHGMQIDPTLYQRFNIEKVPAVVEIQPDCLRDDACVDFNILYGNASLHYALDKFSKQADRLAPISAAALKLYGADTRYE